MGSLNDAVLDALSNYVPVTKAVRWFVSALDEETLKAYLERAYFEIGDILWEDPTCSACQPFPSATPVA